MSRSHPPKAKLRALQALDGRTVPIRRMRDLQAALVADLGGADALSTARQVLIERAILVEAFCRQCESAWLTGGEVDGSYLGAVATLSRLLAQIGTERVARDCTPTLAAYLESKAMTS